MTTALSQWIPFMGANSKEKESQLAPTGVSDPYVQKNMTCRLMDEDTKEEMIVSFEQNRENGIELVLPHPRCARLLWVECK